MAIFNVGSFDYFLSVVFLIFIEIENKVKSPVEAKNKGEEGDSLYRSFELPTPLIKVESEHFCPICLRRKKL